MRGWAWEVMKEEKLEGQTISCESLNCEKVNEVRGDVCSVFWVGQPPV